MKSLEIYPVLFLQERTHELPLHRLIALERIHQLTLETVQEVLVVAVGLDQLLAQVPEVPEVTKYVESEEQDGVVLQFSPTLYLPLLAVCLFAQLSDSNSTPLGDDEAGLSRADSTF